MTLTPELVNAAQICTEEESLAAREALRALMLETGRASSEDDAEPLLQQEALEKRCASSCLQQPL